MTTLNYAFNFQMLKSGGMNPTTPWHISEERADLLQSISQEFYFGRSLTEAPFLHKTSEGLFCLF